MKKQLLAISFIILSLYPTCSTSLQKRNPMEKIIKINDLSIWTESFGNQNNPCILLVSGAGALSTFWPTNFCNQLAQAGFFVIRYDNRDTGYSTHLDVKPELKNMHTLHEHVANNNIPYTIDDLVNDAFAVLENYDIKNAHVVGHSMGGYIVQLMALQHPEKILSITPISAGPPIKLSDYEKYNIPPVPEKTWDVMTNNSPVQNFEKDLPGFLRVWKYLQGSYSFDKEFATTYTKDIYKREPFIDIAWHHVACMHTISDKSVALENLQIPALIIHGDDDKLQPVELAQALNQILPNSTLKIIPQAGHMFFNKQLWKLIGDMIIEHVRKIS